MSALEPILERAREAVAARRRARPLAVVQAAADRRRAEDPVRDFAGALSRPGLSIIAEHKRRSPSAGLIRDDLELEAVVAAYARGGAAAVSVLTEEQSFGGSLADLARARTTVALPLLRKDFIVDAYQVTESLAGGADAILLIVAALQRAELEELYGLAAASGLAVLVEVHDQRELDLAGEMGARVVGINNRDLTTLGVDTGRTLELVPRLPAGVISVAESGFRTREELERLARAGVDAALVGEAMMRSADIEAACRDLTGTSFSTGV
jgi:indole-3-glycerol phosphate synthase